MKKQRLKTLNDDALMECLARGDTESLGELYLRQGAMVESAIRRFAPAALRPSD